MKIEFIDTSGVIERKNGITTFDIVRGFKTCGKIKKMKNKVSVMLHVYALQPPFYIIKVRTKEFKSFPNMRVAKKWVREKIKQGDKGGEKQGEFNVDWLRRI